MSTAPARKGKDVGKPAWDIARLYPDQGYWDEWDYLALETNQLVEFSDGFIEVLPMPSVLHQEISAFLYEALLLFVRAGQLGKVLYAPVRIQLWPGKFREPDLVFMLAEHTKRIGKRYWKGADLVIEIVSTDPQDRRRDLVEKRREYARARIPEYWIVDPKKSAITVLRLGKQRYIVAGKYGPKDQAKSVLLPGLEVNVAAALAGK